MKRKQIARIESAAQRLVEGVLDRLLGQDGAYRQLAVQLAEAVEDSESNGMLANHYLIFLSPSDLQTLATRAPDLETQLARYISQYALGAPANMLGEPVVQLQLDATLTPHDVRVEARHVQDDSGSTQPLTGIVQHPEMALGQLDAFLIVNGKRHVPLDKPLLTLGRSIDSDIIIDSPLVSRTHAHIRWRYGRFVLLDAGSRGGLLLNGEPSKECVLNAGDLILLSGQIPLIYGEGLENRALVERPPSAKAEETQVLMRKNQ